jgi:hypothetical protein
MEAVLQKIQRATKAPQGPRRLCKDCAHCKPEPFFGFSFAKCTRPTGDICLVTGDPKRIHDYCSVERKSYGSLDTCREIGRYWEPAPPTRWQRIRKFFAGGR